MNPKANQENSNIERSALPGTSGAEQVASAIIFFDGECNLCNGFIDWVLRRDSQRRFYIASLQGKTARARLTDRLNDEQWLKSVVLWEDGEMWLEDEAVLKVLARLPGFIWLAQVLGWLPRSLRVATYRWVARHRLAWFGRRNTCRIPGPDETARFLP